MDLGTNTYNNFLLSIPKKQAKSYEIDLGQNNGAYDEELLIRYGDNTLNHMKNKNRGGNLNMDDIMKMNEQLRPFQERQPQEEGVLSLGQICEQIENNIGKIDDSAEFLVDFEKNLNKAIEVICEQIENNIGKIDDSAEFLVDFEKNLNKAIEVMTNDIFKFFDDTYNEFNPKLLEKYSYLKSKIKEQKDENANLLKQIDFLLQENTQIMDMVYKIGSRLEKLEKKAGIDKPDMSYDKNLEEQKSGEESEQSGSESVSQSQVKSKENENENNEEEQKENKEGEENENNNEEGKINEENDVIHEDEKNQSKDDMSEKDEKEQEDSKEKSKEINGENNGNENGNDNENNNGNEENNQ